jgi:hypothetical protein
MARRTNTAGSSNKLREDVLRVLGVLKVATVDQIQRAAAPHLTYRHTDKPTASAQKTARTAAHAGALADLRADGMTENGGSTRGGERLRNLTTKGLEGASYALGRPMWEMGGTARGAGSSGATHPMAVNETVLALLRPKPDVELLSDNEPAEALQAARAAVDAPAGLGTLDSYTTEVALPVTGTWTSPGKGGAQADIVVTAAENGIPLLFVEVDNCHENAQKLAAKIGQYHAFFTRHPKGGTVHDAKTPMWRSRWWVPDPEWRENPHPPILLVFQRLGPRNPDHTIRLLQELTYRYWAGSEGDGYRSYDRKIPIVVTGYHMLREHGPAGQIFRRFGREGFQTLADAVGNPRLDALRARQYEESRAGRAAHEAEQQRQAAERQVEQQRQAAEREARRPACTKCRTPFADDRWDAVQPAWGSEGDSHPTLCTACKQRAQLFNRVVANRARAEEAAGQRQEAAAEPEPRVSRWRRRNS